MNLFSLQNTLFIPNRRANSPKQIGPNRKRTSITHSNILNNITSAAIRDPCSTRHTKGG